MIITARSKGGSDMMLTLGLSPARRVALAPKTESSATMRNSNFCMGLSDYGGYGADNRANDSATAFAVVTFVLAVELEGLFPRGRAEVVLDYDQELVGIGTASRVVETERLAFKQHAVIVDEHRTVDEFQGAFTVILEVPDGVHRIGVVALRLDFKAELYGLAFGDFVTVGHHFDGEGIALLDVEVIVAGGHEHGCHCHCNGSDEAEVIAKRFRSETEKGSAGREFCIEDAVEDMFHLNLGLIEGFRVDLR